MKKGLPIILCVALLLSSCSREPVFNGKTEYFAEMLMVEDFTDMYLYVGFEDYVFVGTVEKVIKPEISVMSRKHEDQYSIYGIHVDRCIKGQLKEYAECSKFGGLGKDGTMYLAEAEMPGGVFVKDTGLPEAGKQYVFMANAQPDGSLLLSEIFDNREFTEAIFVEYTDYYLNEVPYERERFTAAYAAG